MRLLMRYLLLLIFLFFPAGLLAEAIPGFVPMGEFNEQVRQDTFDPDVRVTMVAPPTADFDSRKPTQVILFALPNGNSTEWTIGRKANPELDWHYDIQHIGAQTRALRAAVDSRNIVVVYLEAGPVKSWPWWRQQHANNAELIPSYVSKIKDIFADYDPTLVISNHSGGGSLTWGYLNGVESIPPDVTRFIYLDSNYSFSVEDGHGQKFIEWLKGDPSRELVVIAYDDRNVTYNGKKIVSDTGGTYRATHRMMEALKGDFLLVLEETDELIHFSAPQLEMIIHKNPENKILHTVLVGEMNGFIHGVTVGTEDEGNVGRFGPPRAYDEWVAVEELLPPSPPAEKK